MTQEPFDFALLLTSGSLHARARPMHEAMTERLSASIWCHGKEGRTINAEHLPLPRTSGVLSIHMRWAATEILRLFLAMMATHGKFQPSR